MRNIEQMTDYEIAQYLRTNRNKAVIVWGSEDVKAKAEEMGVELSDVEIDQILRNIDGDYDAEQGVSWFEIESEIDTILENR